MNVQFLKSLATSFHSKSTLTKVGTVLSGSILAQLVLVGSVPFLTRLYSVSAFGELGFFMLVGMFGIQLLSLRFDFGIAAAPTSDVATRLLVLSSVVATVTAGLFSVIVIGISRYTRWQDEYRLISNLPWLIFYVWSGAIWNAFTYYNIRHAAFKRNAVFSVIRAVAIVSISFLLVRVTQFNGLVIGLGIGHFFMCIILWVATISKPPMTGELGFWSQMKPGALLATAREHKGLLRYSAPSAMIELFAGQLPQFIIGSFGSLVFGWFAQANRLLNAPLDLIGQSVRSVFWETAGKYYREHGECIRLFDKALLRLLVLSVAPFLVLLFAAPWLFEWVLGAGWAPAGRYAQILLPFCFFRFLSNPLGSMFYISNNQRMDLLIQAVVFLVVLILFFLPWPWLKSAEFTLAIYSVIYSAKYIAELLMARRFALGTPSP